MHFEIAGLDKCSELRVRYSENSTMSGSGGFPSSEPRCTFASSHMSPSTQYAKMDAASRALALELPPGVPDTKANRAEHGKACLSTLYHRAAGRPSVDENNQDQQWLTPPEEKSLIKFHLNMTDIGHPVRIKYIGSLASDIACHRPIANRPLVPPGKNWPREFEKCNPIPSEKSQFARLETTLN
jgi:hypothetical protein